MPTITRKKAGFGGLPSTPDCLCCKWNNTVLITETDVDDADSLDGKFHCYQTWHCQECGAVGKIDRSTDELKLRRWSQSWSVKR